MTSVRHMPSHRRMSLVIRGINIALALALIVFAARGL